MQIRVYTATHRLAGTLGIEKEYAYVTDAGKVMSELGAWPEYNNEEREYKCISSMINFRVWRKPKDGLTS